MPRRRAGDFRPGAVPLLPGALYLIHALAVAAGMAQGFPASAMRDVFLRLPEGYGFGRPAANLLDGYDNAPLSHESDYTSVS